MSFDGRKPYLAIRAGKSIKPKGDEKQIVTINFPIHQLQLMKILTKDMELFKSRSDCVCQLFQRGLESYIAQMRAPLEMLEEYGDADTWDGEPVPRFKITMDKIQSLWPDVYEKIIGRTAH